MASDWNGLPENPERDGWHWISTLPQLPPSPWRWSVADGVGDWFAPGSRWCSPLGAVACHTYLGPCLTPADLAAAVEAAVQAERADCARHIDARVAGWRNAENPEDETVNGYLAFAGQLLSHEIRARGPTPAYDAAIRAAYKQGWDDREGDFLAGTARIGIDEAAIQAAREDGMEAAVKIAQSVADDCDVDHRMRLVAIAIRDSIRAAAGGGE